MAHESSPPQADALDRWQQDLRTAIALTEDLTTHPEAKAQFEALYAQLADENAAIAALLRQLWESYVTAQRGSAFWQEMSEAEKALGDQAVQNGIQIKQNYLRLMQEM